MQSIEIGEVTLTLMADGRIQVQIAPWPRVTTWTAAGAQEAVAWLQARIAEQTAQERTP
jgi:hypothetical protein